MANKQGHNNDFRIVPPYLLAQGQEFLCGAVAKHAEVEDFDMLAGRGSTALRQLVLQDRTHALLVGHVYGLDKGVAEHGNAERVGRFVWHDARATPSVRV